MRQVGMPQMNPLDTWTTHRLGCSLCLHHCIRTACRRGLPLYLTMLAWVYSGGDQPLGEET